MTQLMKDAFATTMQEVGLEDEKLVVIVGDIGHFALQPFAQSCPGRYYNVGILEPTIVSMAAGLSRTGLYPVAHTIAPFLIERSFEQIKLDFCYQELGGTLMSVGSAFEYSTLGCSHHCYDDASLIGSLPNTEVIFPATPQELNLLFRQSYQNNKLTYIRMPKATHSVEFDSEIIKLGKGIKVRDGKDITLIAAGSQLNTVMQALDVLIQSGIDVEVLYYHTLKPFDKELVSASISKTRHALVIEEHIQPGGLGSSVLRETHSLGDVKYHFMHIPDHFLRGYGSYQDHCESIGFTPDNIINQVAKLLERS